MHILATVGFIYKLPVVYISNGAEVIVDYCIGKLFIKTTTTTMLVLKNCSEGKDTHKHVLVIKGFIITIVMAHQHTIQWNLSKRTRDTVLNTSPQWTKLNPQILSPNHYNAIGTS